MILEQLVAPLHRGRQRPLPARRQPVLRLASNANRSSRRFSSCAAPSASTRAAASSIASGIPSSRPTSRATTARVSPVSANPVSAARARSANNVTASAPAMSSPGPDTGSGDSRYAASPAIRSASRLVARTRTSSTGAQQPRAQLRGRADHVLAVIQHHQQLPPGQHPH